MPYNFVWSVFLKDGSPVCETDEPAPCFRDIAADVTDLGLVPMVEGWPTYRLALNPGQRAIWCRRHFRRLGGEQPDPVMLHIIGFQYTAPDGKNYQSLIYVPDDGSPVMYGPGPFNPEHAVYGWVLLD